MKAADKPAKDEPELPLEKHLSADRDRVVKRRLKKLARDMRPAARKPGYTTR
jgi:hypothetical protein